MVEWLAFGLNTVIPILIGLVVFLSFALYVVVHDVRKRVPTKEEMMDMGFTLINTAIDEKASEWGLSELLSKNPSPGGPSALPAGRPPEGMMSKLMWFAENTEIGRQLASRFIGGMGGGGEGSKGPGYYG